MQTNTIETAIEKLKSSDLNEQELALDIIGSQKPPNALGLILPYLHNENSELRSAAAFNLGEIGNPDAVPHLLNVSENDNDDDVRFYSLDALANYHDPAILKYLIHLVRSKQESRRIKQTVATQLATYDTKDAIDSLVTLLDDNDPHVVIPVVDALFKFNRDQLKDIWMEIITDYFHPYICKIAVKALANLENTEEFELMQAYANDPDPKIRKGSAFVLGFLDDARVIPLLLQIARNDPILEIRDMAILSMSEYRDNRIKDFMIEAISRETLSLQAKESIAEQLRYYNSPESKSALNLLAEDDEPTIRATAIDSLEKLEFSPKQSQ